MTGHRLRVDETGVYLDGRKIDVTHLHLNAHYTGDMPAVYAHLTIPVEPTIDLHPTDLRLITDEPLREST